MTETIYNTPASLNLVTSMSDFSLGLTFGPVDARIDLTGYTFAALVHANGADTSWTIANTNLAGGIITISLTDVQITAIGKGYHSWDIEANSGVASGDRYYISGLFQVV